MNRDSVASGVPPPIPYPGNLLIRCLRVLLLLTVAPSASAQLILSEFLAENRLGRRDNDGETEDWIEIHNASLRPVSLAGWSLTDSPGNPRKWEFPAMDLPSGGFLLVFASGKDRRNPSQPLHTNFRLAVEGEYLALIGPDLRPTTEFAPAYPPQIPDVSFGFSTASTPVTLLPQRSAGTYLVPTNDSLGNLWIEPGFPDDAWKPLTTGFGLDPAGTLAPHVVSSLSNQDPIHPSIYVRLPFVITNLTDLTDLALEVRYNDGFAAYLNGRLVAQRNAPIESTGGVVADQLEDWDRTGRQGVHGWYYGYYDAASDSDRVYDAFSDFTQNDPQWAWSGAEWSLGPGNPPWTLIGPEAWHPNGSAGGVNVQWAIRRWVSQAAGPIKILLGGAKQNLACGNGVTFRVFVNGEARFSRSIAANDSTGFTTTLLVNDVDFGDLIDFALDPTGPNGSTEDGCDGSSFVAQVLQDPNPGLQWNSRALRARSVVESTTAETLSLDGARDQLVVGTNLLAVHLLNAQPQDATLLLAPELTARIRTLQNANPFFFPTPTPIAANAGGVPSLGPLVVDTAHSPRIPADAQDLVVTATVRPTLRPVAGVRLAYRVQYASELSLPMHDDGQHGDGAAADGVWGATIPASAAGPGQMIRWAIHATDIAQVTLRHPQYLDASRSPQYLGTVVQDPSLADSRIPILHWFVQNPGGADTDAGARGSLFFEGEFYDNVGANVHGQSTRGFPKRSYDFDFNPGFKFRWREGQPRIDDFNLLTTWADKSHLRNILAYETYAQAGALAHFAIPVRVQQNGRFFSVANLVENGDDNFLERLGLDPRGALYKMYNVADSTSGAEKKTRKTEGTQDLAALIRGISTGTTAARQAYLFDNLDLPVVVNYLAARALTGDTDCCHKNYYLYRDSEGSGEWSGLPWDVDLSFGRVWTCGSPCLSYFDETIYTNTALFVGENNTVFSAVLGTPATRQMYLRRLRTLADEITQPPGTPPGEDRWLQRSTQLRDQIAPDAARDLARWGTWGRRESITQAVDRIHREFLPGRRNYLFNTLTRSGTLPAAQPINAAVRFARLESRTSSGNRWHEFLEITNANAFAVDLSDWSIDGPVRFRFKPGTVLPARSNAIVSPDRRQFRARTVSPKGGERLLVLGNYEGELDARGGTLTLLDPRRRLVATAQIPIQPSPAQAGLRITELMIQPAGSGDAEEAEYVELQNIGTTPLDLTGVRFTEGITFDFSTSALRNLAPGQRVLVVANLSAFQARYGFGFPVAGTYLGRLSNSGETLRLEDASGEPILDFTFDPTPFPLAAGLGHSLVLQHPNLGPAAWSDPGNWKPSARAGGSPGTDEPAPANPRPASIVIHELLAHTDPPLVDAVELHNPSSTAADVSGWWLSDDPSEPRKFQLPAGTRVAPFGYLVLDESQFNNPGNRGTRFSFSSHGDDVWLFGANSDGTLNGYADGVSFPASANGVSFGRFTNSVGEILFPSQASRSLGGPNSNPSIGPVVITEILASPARGGIPFIELRNITSVSVPLFDPEHPTNTWRIHGVDFSFQPGVMLPAGAFLLVVGGDPATFRAQHSIAPGVTVFGPWSGSLQADGERLAVERPDAPDTLPDGSMFVPFVEVDAVRFRHRPPWPLVSSDGTSIERIRATSFGNDPAHWRANPDRTSPGYDLDVNRPPVVVVGPDLQVDALRFPLEIPLKGFASDDGLPESPGRLTVAWTQTAGTGVIEFTDSQATNTIVRIPGPDRYTVRLTAFDGAMAQPAEVTLDVRRTDPDPILLPAGSSWRYFASNRAPGVDWMTAGFNDSAWPAGEAQLGYGDNDERTTLPDTVNGTKVFTAYFRRTFQVANPGAVQGLTARLLRDDGAAVWLNGTSVHRSNLPEGPLAFDTPATATISGTDESTFLEVPLPVTALRTGTNILAVEVHQQNASSSDLSFDLELTVSTRSTNHAPTLELGQESRVTVGQPMRPAVVWQDDGLIRVPVFRWEQRAGPALASFSATNSPTPFLSFPIAGRYDLRLTVFDGEFAVADDITINAVASDASYLAWRQQHFSPAEQTDAAISGDDADPDGDRQPNLAEYRSGTDPRDAQSVLRLNAVLGNSGEILLQAAVVAHRTYQVEWSATARDGSWQRLRTLDPVSAPQVVIIPDPASTRSGPARFYRLSTGQ
jgi:hypothetical protein